MHPASGYELGQLTGLARRVVHAPEEAVLYRHRTSCRRLVAVRGGEYLADLEAASHGQQP